jgi:hypothetical protein
VADATFATPDATFAVAEAAFAALEMTSATPKTPETAPFAPFGGARLPTSRLARTLAPPVALNATGELGRKTLSRPA